MNDLQSHTKRLICQMINPVISCWKCNLFKNVVRVSTCSVLLLVLVGCTSIEVKDPLARRTPKGYVEFYMLQGEGYPDLCPWIYSIPGIREVSEGSACGGFHIIDTLWHKVGLRLARGPGTYQFVIRAGDAKEYIWIRIEEGKITPVRIKTFIVNKTETYLPISDVTVVKTYFKMSVLVEKSKPAGRWHSSRIMRINTMGLGLSGVTIIKCVNSS